MDKRLSECIHLTGLLKLYVRYFRGIPDVELDVIKLNLKVPLPAGEMNKHKRRR